jgi:sulfite exporter TauE/SafE
MKDVDCSCAEEKPMSTGGRWLRAGGALILMIALYVILKRFGIFSLTSTTEGAMGLSTIFFVGLVAATSSCLAVVGGLLLSVSAKWAESRAEEGRWATLQPMLLFNAGRLAGYFLLGGVAGLLGRSLALTPWGTGLLTAIVAVVMIGLGLNILHIVPKNFCRIPLPASMQKRIHALSHSHNPLAPLLLGALTFFLPCGFTQSMQILALGSGSFLAGATIMFVFALGTLPSLLGISLLSSLLQGRAQRWFFTFSGALVLLLGIMNVRNGLLLMGYDVQTKIAGIFMSEKAIGQKPDDPYVTIDAQGRQIVSMYISDAGYSPNSFTIEPGRETWIYGIAQNGVSGCASFLVDSTHRLETPIKKGTNWLGPIKDPTGDFVLTCSMGMLRANIHVKQG